MEAGERLGRWLAGLSRADLILLAVPLLFVGGFGVGTLLFERLALAVGAAAVACCPVIGDGLFWHPPVEA